MRCLSVIVTALSVGSAVANPLNHARFHKKDVVGFVKDNIQNNEAAAPAPSPEAPAPAPAPAPASSSPGNRLTSEHGDRLDGKSIKRGTNSEASGSGIWFGSDGPYTNEFTNSAGEDKVLVVWGPWGSWVNKEVPLITASLAKGQSLTLSFAKGQTGGWAAVGKDTTTVNGQIFETWGEITTGFYGAVDVSRLVNMGGSKMSISTPTCTSDFDRCVFVCNSGNSCLTGYELLNCGPGSQPWANYGIADGAPSGGCGGMGDGAALKTVFY